MPFLDRWDAGRRLAERLMSYKDKSPVILGLPRGGVVVAAEVAAALQAPLDLVLVRKIGVPVQPELAMGAVVDGGSPVIVRNEEVILMAGISEESFQEVCRRELAEIERRRQRYLQGRPPIPLAGRTVIVVDDGIATGSTTRAALRAVRKRGPGRLVLAVPVAPTEAVEAMRKEADEFICLEDYVAFGGVGQFYRDFRQTSDEDVIALLAGAPTGAAVS